MRPLTWAEVLRNTDLIGGVIESQVSGTTYQGYIQDIVEDDAGIRFVYARCHRLDPKTGAREQHCSGSAIYVDKELTSPRELEDGRVTFTVPQVGEYALHPRRDHKPDSARVTHLKLVA